MSPPRNGQAPSESGPVSLAPNQYRAALMAIDLPFRLGQGFDRLYGLEVTHISDELLRGRVAVTDTIKQPGGLVHGGVYAAIAESLASTGTALKVIPDGKMAMGLSNLTSFVRPITTGSVNAEARARHRGRTTWVWEVEMSDDEGRLCVLARVTIAVRELRPEDERPPSGASAG
jgi:1,4-dihydroxy-2-naphthoyl-CoA hydrolase